MSLSVRSKTRVYRAKPSRLPETLTHEAYMTGLRALSRYDADLKRVIKELGPPPMWARRPGFATLVRIILEQQVSLASARATYEKLQRRVKRLTPSRFLTLDARTLKACGFSRQKTEYCRQLARAVLERRLILGGFQTAGDTAVKSELVKVKGIGSWSADIYLLMALRRPDVWPSGDLALASAVRRVKGLSSVPSPDELERIGLPWRPWRAVAARILWHFYLNERAAG